MVTLLVWGIFPLVCVAYVVMTVVHFPYDFVARVKWDAASDCYLLDYGYNKIRGPDADVASLSGLTRVPSQQAFSGFSRTATGMSEEKEEEEDAEESAWPWSDGLNGRFLRRRRSSKPSGSAGDLTDGAAGEAATLPVSGPTVVELFSEREVIFIVGIWKSSQELGYMSGIAPGAEIDFLGGTADDGQVDAARVESSTTVNRFSGSSSSRLKRHRDTHGSVERESFDPVSVEFNGRELETVQEDMIAMLRGQMQKQEEDMDQLRSARADQSSLLREVLGLQKKTE